MRPIDADEFRKLIKYFRDEFQEKTANRYVCNVVLSMLGDEKQTHTLSYTDIAPRGEWLVFDECSNAGIYCSHCHKKVYKERYANCKHMSDFCPNCGAIMSKRLLYY